MEYKPPKDRKHVYIYMSYTYYMELLELKKKHANRIKAIKQGRSNMDLQYELDWLEEIDLEGQKKLAGKTMANNCSLAGPIWDWLQGIKGLGSNSLFAAQLIAQIDDINKFPTISKLWRFAGYAVFEGKAEPRGKYKAAHDDEEKRHYNGKLKGLLYNIVGSFIKSQSSPYADVYYEYKARQRELHPVPVCRSCQVDCVPKKRKGKNGDNYDSYVCPNNASHVKDYTNDHLHLRAIRKTAVVFLKDLWLEWRRLEGLPISEPWDGYDRSET